MSTVLEIHIEIDKNGVARIAGTTTKVIEVAIDKIARGSSPEEIYFQYPHLTLAQIYSALAYYYDHKDSIDSQIAGQLERVEKLAEQAKDSPGRQRLRSRRLLSEHQSLDGRSRPARGHNELSVRAIDVLTAQEDGTTTLPDGDLLDRATAVGRVLFTHDADLLEEAVRRQRSEISFLG